LRPHNATFDDNYAKSRKIKKAIYRKIGFLLTFDIASLGRKQEYLEVL